MSIRINCFPSYGLYTPSINPHIHSSMQTQDSSEHVSQHISLCNIYSVKHFKETISVNSCHPYHISSCKCLTGFVLWIIDRKLLEMDFADENTWFHIWMVDILSEITWTLLAN